ncbi:MAG: hypothetical protein JWP33_2847 [Blastococcus sp.]|nr:hypothetical protein [Blastococcus sp.]
MTSIFDTQHDSGSRARFFPSSRRFQSASAAALVALVAPALVVAATGEARAADPVVRLGLTSGFSVLAGSAVTNTGRSEFWADIGLSPGSSIGGGQMVMRGGVIRTDADTAPDDAQVALSTAWTDAANAGPASMRASNTLGLADGIGETLGAGVYEFPSTIDLTGVLTLDGGGREDAVFIFQAGSDLTTASSSQVNLTGGAKACNVFWKVNTATLGTTSSFRGNLLANTSITLTTGATVEGRVLARSGAVTLDSNVISEPGCAAGATNPTTDSSDGSNGGDGSTGATATATATATAPATASGGAGGGQVRRVPVGSVDTGDGSSSAAAVSIRRLFSPEDTVDAAAARLWR